MLAGENTGFAGAPLSNDNRSEKLGEIQPKDQSNNSTGCGHIFL